MSVVVVYFVVSLSVIVRVIVYMVVTVGATGVIVTVWVTPSQGALIVPGFRVIVCVFEMVLYTA